MADRALSDVALRAGLQDIRLPAESPGGPLAEALASVGLGLSLALLVALVLRSFAVRWRDPVQVGLPESDAARRRALLRQLRDERPDVYARIRDDLYKPGCLPELAALEAELARNA